MQGEEGDEDVSPYPLHGTSWAAIKHVVHVAMTALRAIPGAEVLNDQVEGHLLGSVINVNSLINHPIGDDFQSWWLAFGCDGRRAHPGPADRELHGLCQLVRQRLRQGLISAQDYTQFMAHSTCIALAAKGSPVHNVLPPGINTSRFGLRTITCFAALLFEPPAEPEGFFAAVEAAGQASRFWAKDCTQAHVNWTLRAMWQRTRSGAWPALGSLHVDQGWEDSEDVLVAMCDWEEWGRIMRAMRQCGPQDQVDVMSAKVLHVTGASSKACLEMFTDLGPMRLARAFPQVDTVIVDPGKNCY